MAYDDIISRVDISTLERPEYSNEIFAAAVPQSVVLSMGRRLPNMGVSTRNLPVLNALPTAYFVSGDSGMKQTTESTWANKQIIAEELAVLVPIPESVLADASVDVYGQIKPHIAAAIGKAFDAAVLHGTNKPASWPSDLVTGITAASNVVSLAACTDLYDAVLGENGTFALIEADGYLPKGSVAHVTMAGKIRGCRSAFGTPIFQNGQFDGSPMKIVDNGSMNPAAALLISGDWSQLVYAFRQDITFKLFTEGVISDGSGAVITNLMQQDSVCLRVTCRLGWQLPNPPNWMNASTQYPFALLTA